MLESNMWGKNSFLFIHTTWIGNDFVKIRKMNRAELILKITYSSAITLPAILKTRSARRLARCLLPAFLCAHVIKRDVWVRGSHGCISGQAGWIFRFFFNRLGCLFNCEDHFHSHIFIRSSKYDSFPIFPFILWILTDCLSLNCLQL